MAIAAGQAEAAFRRDPQIANPVGPRDRAAWRIDDALAALTAAAGGLDALVRELVDDYR